MDFGSARNAAVVKWPLALIPLHPNSVTQEVFEQIFVGYSYKVTASGVRVMTGSLPCRSVLGYLLLELWRCGVLIVACVFLLSCSASAATDNGLLKETVSVDVIDEQILARELELLEMNARIRERLFPKSMWTSRRLAFYSVANLALTAVGAKFNAVERLENEDTPKRKSSNVIIGASKLRFLANSISTVAASYELGHDEYHAWKERRRGFDVKVFCKRANGLSDELSVLLQQREAAGVVSSAHQAEGAVLRSVRDIALSQFAEFVGEFKGRKSRQRMNYFLTGTANAVSAVGTYCGVIAEDEKKPKLGRVGGFTDVITSSMCMSIPVVSRVTGASVKCFHKNRLCKELDCGKKYNLADFRANLKLLKDSDSNSRDRCLMANDVLLTKLERLIEQQELLRTNTRRQARRSLVENESVAVMNGCTKMTNGIGTLIGTYPLLESPRAELNVTGSCALVYSIGSSLAGLEIVREQLFKEVDFAKKGKRGTRPDKLWHQQELEIKALREELAAR